MKDFKKASILLLKRNGFWLLLSLLVVLIFTFFATNDSIEVTTRWYSDAFYGIEQAAQGELDGSVYYKGTHVDKLKAKYPKKLPVEIFETYDDLYNQAKKIYNDNSDSDAYREIKYVLSDYDTLRFNLNENSYRASNFKDGQVVLAQQEYVVINVVLFFGLILGFLFTSMEHFTPYYEFTRMLPWSKTKTYFSKLGLGTLLVTLAYVVLVGFSVLLWQTSYVSNLLYTGGLLKTLALGLGKNILFFIVVVGLGTVAGNIFGHLGMMIIGLGGPMLLTTDYKILKDMLGLGLDKMDAIYKFEDLIDNKFYYPLYVPIEGLFYVKNQMLIGFAIFSLIIFALGLYWTSTARAERSGMLILKKSVSTFAFFMAVVTSVAFFGQVFNTFVNTRGLIMLPIYAVIGFIFYKLYKIFFNIKIGV